MLLTDIPSDVIGRRLPGRNPIRSRLSTQTERDAYMNSCDYLEWLSRTELDEDMAHTVKQHLGKT